MTETTCPCCGGKCKLIQCPAIMHDGDEGCDCELKPLPPPDLTKLREAYKNHMVLFVPVVMSDDDMTDEELDRVIQSAGNLLRAVKELLEENKP